MRLGRSRYQWTVWLRVDRYLWKLNTPELDLLVASRTEAIVLIYMRDSSPVSMLTNIEKKF